MTPQERDLLTNLVSRLRQSPPQQTDPEAEATINALVDEKPDTPYVLAQTVLIQDYALHQAQDRIADLEQQLQGQPARKTGGFLSAIFGGGEPPPQRPPQYQQTYQQQTYQQQPAFQPQPAYAPPPGGPWGGGGGIGQPSFLRSAATTAAGIAGGALLFQGIESLMGGHGGFGGGGFGGGGFGGAGFMPQPGITETVVNNYYDNPNSGSDHSGSSDTGFDNASFDQGSDFSDSSFDGGGDSGGGGGDDYV